MRLAYASEAESVVDRINRKLHKLQAKLAQDGEKPKWMRWRTFDRLCAQLDAADQAWGLMVLAATTFPIWTNPREGLRWPSAKAVVGERQVRVGSGHRSQVAEIGHEPPLIDSR